jgi:hypothetical protein
MKDVHSWLQPLCTAALRLIEFLNLFLKDSENAARRIAGLEPVSEWVLEEIGLCALLVRFQGIVENQLKVGRFGRRLIMRHKRGSEELRGG